MVIDRKNGLLDEVRHVPSPNCDDRPDPEDISLLIVHGISLPPGEFGGPWIDALFTNTLDPEAHPYFKEIAHLRVSSHVLIRRDGEIVQYVPFHRRAWHAGESQFDGRSRCNDFSIGVELEGADNIPYEDIQYRQLAVLIGQLMAVYPRIVPARITGHCHVAPQRKTDPGPAFEWPRLAGLLGEDELAT